MPRAKNAKGVSEASKQADDGVTLPRLSVKQVGVSGLKVSNGQILQEANKLFRLPHLIPVVNEIRTNPTVGAAMNVYGFMINRKKWCVEASEDASKKTKDRAKIINTMLLDMDDSFESTINSILPYMEYGFGILEIVPYRRLTRNGSRENDGLVGIKKLAIRNQETIARWVFSEDGRELLGVEQNIANLENAHRFANLLNENGNIFIPREKFLLFTSNATSGNPQGNSIYKNIYLAHKQMTMLQEQELLTVAKEAKGMMKIEVPAEYLSPDAPDDGASAEAFKKIIDGHNNGTTAGLLVPQIIDMDSKLPMFNYSLLESKGTPSVDVEAVIKRLQKDILVNMSVDVLALGADGSGSFALAESKTSILALAIDARLKEIQNVFNRELIPYIYRMNGWDLEETPYFVYEDEEDINLEEFSSAVQRLAATDMIERDREMFNIVRKALGAKPRPDTEPVDKEQLAVGMGGGGKSRSGDGMANGTSGSGTAKIGGDAKPVDNSVANKEN